MVYTILNQSPDPLYFVPDPVDIIQGGKGLVLVGLTSVGILQVMQDVMLRTPVTGEPSGPTRLRNVTGVDFRVDPVP